MERSPSWGVPSAPTRKIVLPDTWGPEGPQVAGKGRIDARVAERLDRVIAARGVATRFVRRTGAREIEVLDLPRLEVECVVHNLAGPEFARRYSRREGEALRRPVEEFYLLAGERPMVTKSHMVAFALATPEDVNELIRLAHELNVAALAYLAERSLKLVQAAVNFARDATGRLTVDSELTPETMHLWDPRQDVHYDLAHLPADPDDAAARYRALAVLLGADDAVP